MVVPWGKAFLLHYTAKNERPAHQDLGDHPPRPPLSLRPVRRFWCFDSDSNPLASFSGERRPAERYQAVSKGPAAF